MYTFITCINFFKVLEYILGRIGWLLFVLLSRPLGLFLLSLPGVHGFLLPPELCPGVQVLETLVDQVVDPVTAVCI